MRYRATRRTYYLATSNGGKRASDNYRTEREAKIGQREANLRAQQLGLDTYYIVLAESVHRN